MSNRINKLAIISTHPIQYYAPLFRLIARRGHIAIKVFYTWEQGAAQFDKGFGKEVSWDIPLLEGYAHAFVSNEGNMGRGFKSVRNPTLISEIEQWKADAVLIFGWSYRSHLTAMRYFKKRIPVLFRGDSTLLDEKAGLKKLIRRLFLTWVYSYVDYGLYVGKSNKAYLQANGLQNHELVFTPHAIDNDRFSNDNERLEAAAGVWRKQLGIPEQALVFLFVGKLEPKKSPILLMEAFNEAHISGAHLIFTGNGVLEEDMKVAKEKMEVKDSIHFVNFQNQAIMPVVYRLGNILVLSSGGPEETWGLAVNEAMACGRPVIVSDKCGCAADLVNNETGFVFRSGDMMQLSACLGSFASKSIPEQKEMGINALKKIQDYSFETIALAVEVLVTQLTSADNKN